MLVMVVVMVYVWWWMMVFELCVVVLVIVMLMVLLYLCDYELIWLGLVIVGLVGVGVYDDSGYSLVSGEWVLFVVVWLLLIYEYVNFYLKLL